MLSVKARGYYPSRKMTAGSNRDARRAGSHPAAPAIKTKTAAEAPNVSGSRAGVLKSSAPTKRVAQKLAIARY